MRGKTDPIYWILAREECLRANDISSTVADKENSRGDGFFRVACSVTCDETKRQRETASESCAYHESNQTRETVVRRNELHHQNTSEGDDVQYCDNDATRVGDPGRKLCTNHNVEELKDS